LKYLLKYYKKHIPTLLITLVLLFFQAITELALPGYMAQLIDNGIIAGNMPYIYVTGLKMIIIAVILVASSVLVSLFSSRIGAKISKKIRLAVFERVMSFSNSEIETFGAASLITRSTNDIQQVQMTTIMILRMACFAPIMGIGALLMAYRTSPGLTWTIALALGAVVCIMIFAFSVTMPKFKIVQKMVDKLNLIMNERLTGILVIRAFNTEPHEEARFDQANHDLTKLNLFVNRTMSFMMPLMMLIMNLSSVLIVWAGAKAINLGTLQVGDMLAFMQYSMHVIMSFLFITMIFIMIPRALVSANRIGEVLSTEPTVVDMAAPSNETASSTTENTKASAASTSLPGLVEFKDVSFRYPDADENVINHITFTAYPGQTTALIGSTGSGKSTVINLIPRFYDVTEGEILLDGINIKYMPQKNLRDKIGYIPQKGILFSGTIAGNLSYGKEDATEKELETASKIAQSLDFIKEKPEGFESPIAQGGTNVSGGQKQRLSIARALVKRPDVYIFDDSFSALDFQTDAALRAALKESTGDSTIIIVAQRINTIKNAEQIVVLDDGEIAGIGTHESLLKTCSVYKEIALSQLKEEEL